MKLLKILITIISLLKLTLIQSQTYFSENFETGQLPTNWSQIYVIGSVNWFYQDGGFSDNSEFPYLRKPYPAHGGNYNALFQKESFSNQTTKLVTKAVDLSLSTRPELYFWHAQAERYSFGSWNNDELRIYYKTSSSGTWTKIGEYTSDIENWQEDSILIPANGKTSTFYLAFEGKTNSGWGVCLDDVSIAETNVIQESIYGEYLATASTQSVPTNSQINPVLRMNIKVKGNTGNKLLKSITFTSLNTSDNDITSNGIRLYQTTDSIFSNFVQIGSATSFNSGAALFSNLAYSLSPGNNFFWLTYDINSTAIAGHTIDAKILANSINISDSLYPTIELSPSGNRKIIQSIFTDSFETNTGWTLIGKFGIGAPQGLGGTHFGNPDPSSAYFGNNVLGTVLSAPGDYDLGLSEDAYQAISPPINCKYFKNVHLQFMRWLNIDFSDHVSIKINVNGVDTTIFTNYVDYTDNQWQQVNYDLSNIADRHDSIRIKFTLGPTPVWQASGWNIDNLIVTGDSVRNDVGITKWVQPFSDCGHTNHDSVKIYVKNFGPFISANSIPLAYTFNNGALFVNDTLKKSILPNDSVLFTFKKPVNLYFPGVYTGVYAKTKLASDEDQRNDSVKTIIYSLPTYQIPFTENFEGLQNFWRTGGQNSTWEIGTPSGTIINSAYSGQNAWFTNRDQYLQLFSENSYVESPCVNISDTSKAIIEFKFFSQSQKNVDGTVINYSIDNGLSWHILPNHSYAWKWNWYNSNYVTILSTVGWDTLTNNWTTVKQVLPDSVMNKSQVKFRVIFKTAGYDSYEGIAFDDFKIYKAPANIMLDAITSHTNACQHVNPAKISFRIINNGIRTLIPSIDKIVAGFKINNSAATIDTLNLPSNVPIGQTAILTFNKPAKIDSVGLNNIKVFDIDPNQGFYPVADKDTVELNINIYPSPVNGLRSIYASARLDTFNIYANSDTLYRYKWFNDTSFSTNNILNHPPAGKLWLNTINFYGNGCLSSDTFMVVKLIPDVGVDSLINPTNSCKLTDSVYIKLSVRNKGTDTLNIGDSIRIAFRFESGSPVWDTIVLQKRLIPENTVVHAYTKNPLDMSAFSTYNILAYTVYPYDSVPGNDTLNKQIRTWGFPTVNIGPDTSVTGFYYLHAGPGFKTYLWDNNPAANDSTYRVRSIGNHWVRVTDNHNCPAYDTAYIHVGIHDARPIGLASPVSSCGLGNNEKIKMKVVNSGTDTIVSIDTIKFSYSLNGSAWEKEAVPITDSLFPGDTIIHEFSGSEDFSGLGTHILKLVSKLTNDIDLKNDSLVDTINVYGFPYINIGPDVTVKTLQYTLYADTGSNRSYLWNNGSTNRTLTLTASDTASVIVTDTVHGCASYDTAIVTLEISDGSITNVNAVYPVCKGNFDTLLVEFTNKGNVNIPANDTILFCYVLNDSIQQTDTFKVTSTLPVNGKIIHKFSNLKNKMSVGDNNFVFFPLLNGDLRHNNDTLKKTIKIWPTPIFDFEKTYDDILIVNSNPYILHAPSDTDYYFTWQDGSHDSSYTVNTNGLYKLTVTDTSTGCFNSDSVYVKIYIPDGGIVAVNSVSTACNGNYDSAEVKFENLGNSIIPAGESVLFVYNVNGNTVAENQILTIDLNPGDTLMHTFKNLASKVIPGTNIFKFYSVISSDIDPSDDTLSFPLYINSLPPADLGGFNDTITGFSPYELDAGSGSGYTYLWQDGSTQQTFTVDTPMFCHVKVTDTNTGCFNSDTVFVNTVFTDGAITNVILPDSACFKSIDTIIAEFTNLGDISLYTGQIVVFAYKVGSDTVYKNIMLTSDLLPGQKIIDSLPGLKYRLNPGFDTIKVYSIIMDDLRPWNDTMYKTITIRPAPQINFGATNDTFKCYPSAILSSGLSSSGYNFLWKDNSTGNTINVDQSGYYSLKVTDNATSCVNLDSVYVRIRIPDGGITKVPNDSAICGSTFDHFNVEFSNLGNITLNAGDTIRFAYKLNSQQPYIDAVKLVSEVQPGDKLIHTFNGLSGKVTYGVNNFKVYQTIKEDINPDNDTASFSITLNPFPSISLGKINDTIYSYINKIISTGLCTGYSFLWQNSATTCTITGDISEPINVRVTNNTTNCAISDSAYFLIQNPDGGITSASGQPFSCKGFYIPFAVEFTNFGNSTFKTGDTIKFGYTVNGGPTYLKTNCLQAILIKAAH